MKRKEFIQSAGMVILLAPFGIKTLRANDSTRTGKQSSSSIGWPDEVVENRLYQGPFPVYDGEFPLESVGGWGVVMTTVPSDRILKNFGMGLVIYIMDEMGPPKVKGQSLSETIEKLAQIPFGQKLYMRVNWKDLQKKPGILSPSKAWKLTFDMAKKYDKKIGFRVMLQNPNIPGSALPEFLTQLVPPISIKLGNKTGKNDRTGGLKGKAQTIPKYADPRFQKAWQEFDELLASKYNGDPHIEYMDTYMYGFWGEGHNWPIHKISFPDHVIAEKTFKSMFRLQLKHWDKVPLLTNTEPDFNHIGNDALVRETLRTNNWLRSDTIFIANQQIEELSNRPPWIGSVSEVGMSDGKAKDVHIYNGQTQTANEIRHVMDIDSNYYSLWNWHNISAEGILRYYEKYPDAINDIAKKIGYRIRPSFIWHTEKEGHPGLIFGLVNDGLSGVPGVVKLTLKTERGKIVESGYVDPGYPTPAGVRQVLMVLPKGMSWKGLRLYAGLNVKGQLYPIEWASRQKPNKDGSLTLKPTPYVAS
jgi:hypothetical protein